MSSHKRPGKYNWVKLMLFFCLTLENKIWNDMEHQSDLIRKEWLKIDQCLNEVNENTVILNRYKGKSDRPFVY